MIDWGEPIFHPKDVLKQAARQGGATQEQIDWYDTASPEEIKAHWDLLFEEVQKEINREVVRTIEDKIRRKR